MKDILRNNILGIGSLIVALAALIIAIWANQIAAQANQLFLDSTKADLILDEGVAAGYYAFMTGCRNEGFEGGEYEISRRWDYELTVTNRGGLDASLSWIDVDDGMDRAVRDFELTPSFAESPSSPGVPLPVDIPAGITRQWTVHATLGTFRETKQQALEAAKWPGYPDFNNTVSWTFRFSDGTEYKRETLKIVSGIFLDPDLDSTLDKPCEQN